MKRFWTEVAIQREEGQHAIRLDGKPVRTPGQNALALPTSDLADLIADEWRKVEGEIDPSAMLLTGLANAAIDRIEPIRAQFAEELAAYGANDLLCYRAAEPAALVARQAELWDPLLDWARNRYDVVFETTQGVMHIDQPDETLHVLSDAVGRLDAFELAGLSPLVRTTGSLITALALRDGAIRPATAWNAGQCDEDWQISLWGDDSEALKARQARRRDFDAGVKFLKALRH